MPSKARLPDGWQHTASRSHVTSHECNITFTSGSHPLENNINMVPAAYSVYGLLCYARCKQHGGWYCWVLLGIVGCCSGLLAIVCYCWLSEGGGYGCWQHFRGGRGGGGDDHTHQQQHIYYARCLEGL